MILEQWDVITIAVTGSGKSLIYWMALLFIKHGIVVLVTPLKLLGEQFVCVLDKNELTAVSMTAVNPLHLEQETLDQIKMEMRQEYIGLRIKGGMRL